MYFCVCTKTIKYREMLIFWNENEILYLVTFDCCVAVV